MASTTWSMSCLKSALPSIQPISNSSLRFSSGSSPSRIRICKPKSSSTIIQSFEGLAPLHPLLSLFSQGKIFMINFVQIDKFQELNTIIVPFAPMGVTFSFKKWGVGVGVGIG